MFASDTATEVRDEYRAFLEDEVPDDEAARRVVAAWVDEIGDEHDLFWLALAAAQSEVGRLQDDVRDRALEIIDSGRDLEAWADADARTIAQRRRALAALRERLTGPQPPRQRIRPSWRYVTDLVPGDVLFHAARTGRSTLWRVARLDESRAGTAPVLQQLDWHQPEPPAEADLSTLDALPNLRLKSKPITCFLVQKAKSEPDWRDVGFVHCGREAVRESDADVTWRGFTTWQAFAVELNEGRNPSG